MFTSLFLTMGLIHLIALASPGPDFALILRTSLHRPTALGQRSASPSPSWHATLSLTGISLLIAEHPGCS
jgi:threonine/homoserine/homoserine lactone efflux protein